MSAVGGKDGTWVGGLERRDNIAVEYTVNRILKGSDVHQKPAHTVWSGVRTVKS